MPQPNPLPDQSGACQWRARLEHSQHHLTIHRESEDELRRVMAQYEALGWQGTVEKRVVGPWVASDEIEQSHG